MLSIFEPTLKQASIWIKNYQFWLFDIVPVQMIAKKPQYDYAAYMHFEIHWILSIGSIITSVTLKYWANANHIYKRFMIKFVLYLCDHDVVFRYIFVLYSCQLDIMYVIEFMHDFRS